MEPAPSPHRRVLVLGGARSGKSRFAQSLAEGPGGEPVLVATAQALDREMRDRILRHRADRGAAWRTVEEPLALAETVRALAAPGRTVLVDCLTLWLANLMEAGHGVETATGALVDAVADAAGPVVLVSNEVGQGIVPMTTLGRDFRDAQGRLNQAMAAACDAVVLVVAGCPVQIKPAPAPRIILA